MTANNPRTQGTDATTHASVGLLLQAYYEEYKALQAEIQLRLEAQQTLLNITIALVAGTLLAVTGSIQSGFWDVLLLVPVVFLIIAWWYIGYNSMIGQTARYIHGELAPSVKRILRESLDLDSNEVEKVWDWLAFQYRDFVRTSRNIYLYNLINTIKYAPWVFPSGLALAVFVYLQHSSETPWQRYQALLFVGDLTLWVGTFLALIFVIGWQPWRDQRIDREGKP